MPISLPSLPGLAVCVALGALAQWLGERYGLPAVLLAFAFGVAVNFAPRPAAWQPGIDFAARTVLRLGVGLLGIRLTLADMGALGFAPIAIALIVVPGTILAGTWIALRMGFERAFGILTAGATAICGAAAALAISAVLPARPNGERDTVFAVIGVTTLSTIAMVLYPLLVPILGWDERLAGLFLGGSIHDVAQVVGAGYALSPQTGDIAIYTKLMRVALLLPVVLAVGIYFRAAGSPGKRASAVPWFLLLFIAMASLASSGLIGPGPRGWISDFSRYCLATAIVGLGVKTSIPALIKLGARPVALMVLHSCIILGLAMAAVALIP